MEKAMFGAGCFWGVEAAFSQLSGVVETEVGYSGGTTDNPTYEQVCHGDTGHVEVLQITFDPTKISYEDLVAKFFSIHNPTEINRQGHDFGEQYRSVIFYFTREQQQTAMQLKERLHISHKFTKPIATIIEPAKKFWRAEEYHQKYVAKKGGGSCRV